MSSSTTIVTAAIVTCFVVFDRRSSTVDSIRFAIVFCLTVATAASSSLFAVPWSTCFTVDSRMW